jgi:uncharacterized protein YraI
MALVYRVSSKEGTNMNKNRISLLAGAVLGTTLLCAGIAGAEDVWVKSAIVSVRADKGPIFDEVAVVKKGVQLKVLARENGWVKVDVGGKQGWISEKLISTTKVDANFTFGDIGKTADLSEAKAGRSLKEGAVEYASSKNLNPRPMQELEIFRDNLRKAPQDWIEFMKQGRVGTYAPAK